jgi:hypothetical protein
VAGCCPATATADRPDVTAVIAPAAQRPMIHGLPDGYRTTCAASGRRRSAAAAPAGQSGNMTSHVAVPAGVIIHQRSDDDEVTVVCQSRQYIEAELTEAFREISEHADRYQRRRIIRLPLFQFLFSFARY